MDVACHGFLLSSSFVSCPCLPTSDGILCGWLRGAQSFQEVFLPLLQIEQDLQSIEEVEQLIQTLPWRERDVETWPRVDF